MTSGFTHESHRESLGGLGHIRLGHHPEDHREGFYVNNIDRCSGTVITGKPGSGKSGLLINKILQDLYMEQGSVIVIDPHDLIDSVIARMDDKDLRRTYLLDLTDIEYPFGLNIFNVENTDDPIALSQATDRIMHIFEVQWPDVLSQQYLPSYLRALVTTLLANKGATMLSMLPFLKYESYRQEMTKNVKDITVRQFWEAYDELSPSARNQQVGSLVNKLNAMFMARPIIRNVVSQVENTLNFRKLIDKGDNLFIRLQVNTLTQDANLLGTMLLSQLQAAVFSFSDTPENRRPGFSLYVDEFANFATPTFSKLFTECRKYFARVTVANQYRGQLPEYLRQSTLTARTVICFQSTTEDARELAQQFPVHDTYIDRDSIETDPIRYLLEHAIDDFYVQVFVETYLRSLQKTYKKHGKIEIKRPGIRVENGIAYLFGVKPSNEPILVADASHDLNHVLRETMRLSDPDIEIPYVVVYGYSNSGKGFYPEFRYWLHKDQLCKVPVTFPAHLVVATATGSSRWTRQVETGQEQLFHFIYFLRMTMRYLAENPIAKQIKVSPIEVAAMLTSLPRRVAFVKSADAIGTIVTDDTPAPVDEPALQNRLILLRNQTRERYCRPKSEVETPPQTETAAEGEPETKTTFSRWEVIE